MREKLYEKLLERFWKNADGLGYIKRKKALATIGKGLGFIRSTIIKEIVSCGLLREPTYDEILKDMEKEGYIKIINNNKIKLMRFESVKEITKDNK